MIGFLHLMVLAAIGAFFSVGLVITLPADAAERKKLAKIFTQKKVEAQQIADATSKRKNIVERKKKDQVQRRKMAKSSDLFKGDHKDFVFFVNLSSENVTLGLSDNPAFTKSPISTCYVAPTKIDISGDAFTAGAFWLLKSKIKSEISLKQCGDLDTETSDLIVFSRGIINNANIDTLSKLIKANKDGITSEYLVVNAESKLVEKHEAEDSAPRKRKAEVKKQQQNADSQTSYDGHWFGKLECEGDDFKDIPFYKKEVSLEINGSKVLIGNIGDYSRGDPFTYEGSIELEGSFFLKPGTLSFPSINSTLSDKTMNWLLGGKWEQNAFILSGSRVFSGEDGEMECNGTFKSGKSDKVEEARLLAPEEDKQQQDEEGFGSIFGKLTSGISSGFSDIVSELGGSAAPKSKEAGSATKQSGSQEAGAVDDEKESPPEYQEIISTIGNIAVALSAGGAWGGVVRDFKGGLMALSVQAGVVGEVIADLAEALGLKQEAAVMRAEAKNISEKGDALGADDLDAFRTKSDSTLILINERLMSGVKLDAKQKAKMAEAAARYAPALLKGIQAGLQLASAASRAAAAGKPNVIEGVAIATVALDIPVLVPKAISFVSNSVDAGQKLMAIMREKEIAVPDTDGLNGAMAKMI